MNPLDFRRVQQQTLGKGVDGRTNFNSSLAVVPTEVREMS